MSNNFIQRKKQKKNLEELMKSNVEGSQVAQYFLDKFLGQLSPEEVQSLEFLDTHLLNLNYILNQMKESIK